MSNKITVWGSRKVNIGDYEGNDFGISFTREQINNVDAKAVISDSASMNIEDDDDFEQVVEDMFEKIDKSLNVKEDSLRLMSANYVTDFDTLEKLHNKGNKHLAVDKKRRGEKLKKSFLDDSYDAPVEKRTRKRIKRS